MSKGLLIVYCGCSGVGKGSIMRELLARNSNLKLSVSATTRKPRPGEIDGVHYYFVDNDKFNQMIDNNEFFEHAVFCGNQYGTPKKPVLDMLDEGIDVILEIDIQGYKQIKELYPECVTFFILPPSKEELLRRLEKRGTETSETLKARTEIADFELAQADKFDYQIINDVVSRAAEEILSIIKELKDKEKKS